jgi:hypothetical protein
VRHTPIVFIVLTVIVAGAVAAFALDGPGGTKASITKAEAITFAAAVNLRPNDVPGGKMVSVVEPKGVMAGEQFVCDGRKTKPSHPVARKASLVTDPYEYLASAVEVMPTAAVAQAEMSALDTRRARACLARTLGEIETSESEKRSSSFAVKVATVPVAQLLGPEAVGLHVLAEVPEEPDPTPHDAPTRPVPKPKARFIHVTAAIFRVGPAEILFLAFGAIRQFPAATERHLLGLLHSRAETHKLSL